MMRIAREIHGSAAHYIPYIGVIVAAINLGRLAWAATTGAEQWYPIDLTPAGILTEAIGVAIILNLIAAHHPYLCTHCTTTGHPTATALPRIQRLLRLCHPLPNAPRTTAWYALLLLCAYTTILMLWFAGMQSAAMAVTAAIIAGWPLLGWAHRTWRRWCPDCIIRHPHSLTPGFSANTGLISSMFTEHPHCALVLSCTTADCETRITYDRFDTRRATRATHWLAHHLDTEHPHHRLQASFNVCCRQHDTATERQPMT